MKYWIFQINPEKDIVCNGKIEQYTLEDLEKDIKKGYLDWNIYGYSYYKQVNIGDFVLIKITKNRNSFSSIVALGRIKKTPQKYSSDFNIEFINPISLNLIKCPRDFSEIKKYLDKSITLNKTILPLSSEVNSWIKKL